MTDNAVPPRTTMTRYRGTFRAVAIVGAAVALLAILLLALAGPGYRMGWWGLVTSFGLLQYGVMTGVAAISICTIALLLSWFTRTSGCKTIAVTGIVIALIAIYVPYHWLTLAQNTPPIQDITTNLDAPPQFETLAEQRGADQNPVIYGGPEIAAAQREYYPEVQPVITDLDPRKVFAELTEAVADMNWEMAEIDAENMRIEAVDQTFWFGFRDDIVLIVTPTETGSRVDMRSQSRLNMARPGLAPLGLGDAGTNARRVERFISAFQERLES